jgi:ribonuclease HI
MVTTLYTDGACLNNPGPGGWAWAEPGGAYASGAEPETTNQRMELTAALQAVRANPGTLRVVGDSEYVVNCFVQGWHERWAANGWKNAKRKPVENQDLWRPLLAAYHERDGQVSFEWVKGHGTDPMNDVVDRLAGEAARTQTGRSGTKPPTALGAPDTKGPGRAPGTDATLSSLSGWRVLALGLRPPALGGYDPTNPVAVGVRRKLTEVLTGLLAIHPDVLVLTGLGLGTEQLAAEAAALAGVPYAAVLAYPDPESAWPGPTQQRYRRLMSGATANFTLSTKQPGSKQEAGTAAGKRDRALIAAAHGALVVWDGQDRRLGEHIAALEQRIDDVFVIPPS